MTLLLPANDETIAQAADVIRRGGLVAMPTETVYGLAANALDAAAVERIFRAKGRPATNPVIVHVARFDDIAPLVHETTDVAITLAGEFWPGPLTLVLAKSSAVPDVVTAGGPTVAVRCPSHPMARALITAAGVPLAAPSANRSTCLSPTRAEHVLRGLDGRIDLILDAGPCPGGIESTVLDTTTRPPTLLRPGLISLDRLEVAIGPIQKRTERPDEIPRSPGRMPRHYAPNVPIEFSFDDGYERVSILLAQGHRVGWLTFGPGRSFDPTENRLRRVELSADPAQYAAGLYAGLHELEKSAIDRIVVALPPEDDAWLAIHDRLSRMNGA